MKRIILFICAIILLPQSILFCAVSVCAIAPIDTQRESSLTLQYRLNGRCYEGVEVCTYRIADVMENGTYELCGAFSDYPISIYGVTSKSEWDSICETLASYIAADGLLPDENGVTDSDGNVAFLNLRPGMYLTLAVRIDNTDETVAFEDFITVIPQTVSEDEYCYDVCAVPKCTSRESKAEDIEYKIVKQWKDAGAVHLRPSEIEIEIIKDGSLESVQKLSTDNNWSYKWTAADDLSVWQAVERDVPEGYTVTVQKNGNTIIITNTYCEDSAEPPETGDINSTWPYVVLLCISGGLIILLAIWSKRNEA